MRGPVLRCLMLSTLVVACGGSDLADRDSDGIEDSLDNCPDDANAEQSDQDNDDLGDICDCENNNEATSIAHPDLDDSDRDANARSCGTGQFLSGITEGKEPNETKVDSLYYRCTDRCAPHATAEDIGEGTATTRGPDVNCDPGEVVVGIAYKDIAGSGVPNDYLESVTLLCAPAAGPDSARMVPNATLDANPAALIMLQCPDGATAAGIVDIDSDTSSANSDALDGVSIRCRSGRW